MRGFPEFFIKMVPLKRCGTLFIKRRKTGLLRLAYSTKLGGMYQPVYQDAKLLWG